MKREERMDIIGQNGNDGLHYDVEPPLPKGYIKQNPAVRTSRN